MQKTHYAGLILLRIGHQIWWLVLSCRRIKAVDWSFITLIRLAEFCASHAGCKNGTFNSASYTDECARAIYGQRLKEIWHHRDSLKKISSWCSSRSNTQESVINGADWNKWDPINSSDQINDCLCRLAIQIDRQHLSNKSLWWQQCLGASSSNQNSSSPSSFPGRSCNLFWMSFWYFKTALIYSLASAKHIDLPYLHSRENILRSQAQQQKSD